MLTVKSIPTNKEILTKATELIQTYGWIQHSAGSKSKGYCSFGALHDAILSFYLYWDERDKAETSTLDLLNNQVKNVSSDHTNIVGYNDELNRTKEEVLTIFRRAIDECVS